MLGVFRRLRGVGRNCTLNWDHSFGTNVYNFSCTFYVFFFLKKSLFFYFIGIEMITFDSVRSWHQTKTSQKDRCAPYLRLDPSKNRHNVYSYIC